MAAPEALSVCLPCPEVFNDCQEKKTLDTNVYYLYTMQARALASEGFVVDAMILKPAFLSASP